jgi:hypothetical protein
MKKIVFAGMAKILKFNRLDSFDALWQLETQNVENPNKRRGGRSFVARVMLDEPDGGTVQVFLKRQENDMARILLPPFKIPSYERELRNILGFKKMDIPVVEPLFFEKRKNGKDIRAVLITRALDEYRPFEGLLNEMENDRAAPEMIGRMFSTVAGCVRHIHQRGYEHGALFGKHIYVKTDDTGINMNVRFLDLEMSRKHPGRVVRDLARLYQRTAGWQEEKYLHFLSCYLKKPHQGPDVEVLWDKITARINRKKKSH